MKKLYLAGGISDTARKRYQAETAEELEQGYEVYAAARNNSINDKSNDPTPEDIYNADVDEIIKADIILATISGGNEDGTIFELGVASGWSEAVQDEILFLREALVSDNIQDLLQARLEALKPKEVYAYSTNERALQPQFYMGIPSARINHLVLGGIAKWGGFLGNEGGMRDAFNITRD